MNTEPHKEITRHLIIDTHREFTHRDLLSTVSMRSPRAPLHGEQERCPRDPHLRRSVGRWHVGQRFAEYNRKKGYDGIGLGDLMHI